MIVIYIIFPAKLIKAIDFIQGGFVDFFVILTSLLVI